MPELPEVEVTRLGVEPVLRGARLTEVRMGKPLRWPLGIEPRLLGGRQVLALRRRGKYILIDLDQGLLLLHLGMSGRLSVVSEGTPAGPHDHADLCTDRGIVRLRDPRRFGALVYAQAESLEPASKLLGRLGCEPLEDAFDAASFHAGLARRNAPIKQVLLAGDLVVGVGNIYASEALFLAGIRPTTAASSLSRERAKRLRDAIRQVLTAALSAGGSSLRDFRRADGQTGYFQLAAHVYDRAGEPCHDCESPIRTIRQGQRSTFFCPRCQAR